MRKIILCFLLLLQGLLPQALAAVPSSDLLETALSMLPYDHIIIKQYNEIADGILRAKYAGGVPYYFAGNNPELILKQRYPQQASKWFKLDRMYLYGFDCKGYTRWCFETLGLPNHPSLSEIHTDANKLNLDGIEPSQLHKVLQVGDLYAITYGGRHVMMYIGTLRDYGLIEHPDLQDYLDYPLVIHCGNNPFYYDYYKHYIKQNKINAYPPDGGVTVSLLFVDDFSGAKVRKDCFQKDFFYYEFGSSIISIMDLEGVYSATWWRNADVEQ